MHYEQAAESPLYFRFIWIPDPEHNTSEEQNEVVKRMKEYESTMSLFKEETSFKSDFKVAFSRQDLSTSLVQIDGYRPVFILLGHGDKV